MKTAGHIKQFVLLLATGLAFSQVYAQDEEHFFQTKGGEIIVRLDFGDSAVQLKSNKLLLLLDYDNAVFRAALSPTTLKAVEADSGSFTSLPAGEFSLSGRFEVDHIETGNHEPMEFQFTGVLTNGRQEIPVSGVAQLQHIGGGGDVACLLGFGFNLKQSQIPTGYSGAENLQQIKVQVMQTVLRREKQKN